MLGTTVPAKLAENRKLTKLTYGTVALTTSRLDIWVGGGEEGEERRSV